MRKTIIELRDRIENLQNNAKEEVQRVQSLNFREINTLRQTISSLRDQIEKIENSRQSDIQNATTSQNNEINHFKRMVGALRTELDEKANSTNITSIMRKKNTLEKFSICKIQLSNFDQG